MTFEKHLKNLVDDWQRTAEGLRSDPQDERSEFSDGYARGHEVCAIRLKDLIEKLGELKNDL